MSDFDFEIWCKKVSKKLLLGAIIGALTEFCAYLGTEPVPTEYVWATVFAVEGIELLINYIKHEFMRQKNE